MTDRQHYTRLELNYAAVAANADRLLDVWVAQGVARLTLDVLEDDLDAAGLIDRALYFKATNDAARLAANTLVKDHYVTVESFSLQMVDVASVGPITAVANVLSARNNLFNIEVVLLNAEGHRLAHGHGAFTKGAIALPEYDEELEDLEPETPEGMDEEESISLIIPQVVWQTPFGLIYPN